MDEALRFASRSNSRLLAFKFRPYR